MACLRASVCARPSSDQTRSSSGSPCWCTAPHRSIKSARSLPGAVRCTRASRAALALKEAANAATVALLEPVDSVTVWVSDDFLGAVMADLRGRRGQVVGTEPAAEKGRTIVPLSLYFKDGRAKVEIALATGKRQYDKRQALRERQDKREADRAMHSRSER